MTVAEELKRIKGEIEKEQVSYAEIFYLQEHKKEIIEMGDTILAQWAGIPEEDFFNKVG